MGYSRPPAMLRQRERGRSDRAYVVIEGRRHKLGVWGSEAAERRYRELVAGLAPQVATLQPAEEIPNRPTISELMVPFLRETLHRFRNNEAEQCLFKSAMRVLKEEFADLPAEEFGPRRLRHVRDVMVSKGWARKTVNRQLGRVRKLFKWAAADERLDVRIYEALRTVEPLRLGDTDARETPGVKPVADEVVDATLPHLNPTVAAMVEVQRLCGCRPAELCLMATEFIDRSGPVWIYTPPRHKTQHHGKSRVIALGPKAQAVLQKFLFQTGPFFAHSKGAYTPSSYRQCIRRACIRAFPAPEGLDEKQQAAWNKDHCWKPNQLRHTAATEARKEFGLEGAQHVLGHSKASTTEIYAERSVEQAMAIAARIG